MWRDTESLTSRTEKIKAPKINISNRAKCARVTGGDEATILVEPKWTPKPGYVAANKLLASIFTMATAVM